MATHSKEWHVGQVIEMTLPAEKYRAHLTVWLALAMARPGWRIS